MISLNKKDNGIVTLTINMEQYPMNVINNHFTEELQKKVTEVLALDGVKGVVLTSSRREFIAGADLSMILKAKNKEEVYAMTQGLNSLFRQIETAPFPFVAAMNGTALGGGYELCLACHYRIAAKNKEARVGLVESSIGLIPGAGGTQRLPRMIGIFAALPLMLEAKRLKFEDAKQQGLIDELAENNEEMLSKAEAWILSSPNFQKPWYDRGFKFPGGNGMSPKIAPMLAAGAALLRAKTYGNYPAQQAIASAVYEGSLLAFDSALKVESSYFVKCVMSDVSKSMINTLFYSLNTLKKGERRPKNVDKQEFKKVTVLGAGMMGAGIAYSCAAAGLQVVLKDTTLENAEKGKAYSKSVLEKLLKKGKMSQEKVDGILSLIHPTDNMQDIAGSDLLIETVFEDRNVKKQVMEEAAKYLDNNKIIFASNTSTLPITGLAENSPVQENFIGIHFFSPVDKMPLVEIIKGEKSGDRAVAAAFDFTLKINKTPIVVNDGRGFYTSRVFKTFIFEGIELLKDGVSPILIENAGKMAGMPVGPLAVADEVSIELMYRIMKQTEKDTGVVLKDAATNVINLFYEDLKRIGKKAGKGFYDYPENAKKKLWEGLSQHFPLSSNQPDVELVKKRLLYRQALETVQCLEEGVLITKNDADIGSIFGWGVPPYTGGIINLIDTVGVEKFVEECEDLAKKYGERFKPTPTMVEMAKNNETFASKYKSK
jgi:3-hydroxyacyl-CoA dehydrogenase / enoyl-CoA hydratase / 3-hydroxybutyryl-CoA epimerase